MRVVDVWDWHAWHAGHVDAEQEDVHRGGSQAGGEAGGCPPARFASNPELHSFTSSRKGTMPRCCLCMCLAKEGVCVKSARWGPILAREALASPPMMVMQLPTWIQTSMPYALAPSNSNPCLHAHPTRMCCKARTWWRGGGAGQARSAGHTKKEPKASTSSARYCSATCGPSILRTSLTLSLSSPHQCTGKHAHHHEHRGGGFGPAVGAGLLPSRGFQTSCRAKSRSSSTHRRRQDHDRVVVCCPTSSSFLAM